MYPPPFTYVRAETTVHALELLGEHGDEARPIAGGQSLIPFMKLTRMGPSYVVDIGRLQEMAYVEQEDGEARIGALTPHARLAGKPWPAGLAILGDAANVIADVQVRNRGTIGGSLAYADPAGDWAPALIALKATVRLRSVTGERELPVADLFEDSYATAIADGELITEVAVPPQPRTAGGAYLKLSKRHGDYAIASVAVQGTWSDGVLANVGIGLGGVAPTPIAASEAASFLEGKPMNEDTLAEAAELAVEAASPASDHRGSAEYRRQMIRVLLMRALRIAERRAGGEQAAAGYA